MLCKNENYKQIDLKFIHGSGQPFAIAFAYPRDGPCIIKGSEDDVLNYVNNELGFCHYNFTLWNNKKKFLEEWKVNNKSWKICEKFLDEKKIYCFNYKGKSILNFRSIPKKFIKELEEFSTTKNKKESKNV